MTAREFCYWLQGKLEIDKASGSYTMLDPKQVETIANHLNMVFVHDIDGPDPGGKLQAAHDGDAHPVPGFANGGHMTHQVCSVCKTDWFSCKHGKGAPRPRC